MPEEQQPKKPSSVKERATGAVKALSAARLFVAGLIGLVILFLIYDNREPVPLVILGRSLWLPAILLYVLLLACGALVGIWLEGRRRAQ
ncbi:MAG: hypothetical protein ACE5JM_10615 [Armatimonadota bacterium]